MSVAKGPRRHGIISAQARGLVAMGKAPAEVAPRLGSQKRDDACDLPSKTYPYIDPYTAPADLRANLGAGPASCPTSPPSPDISAGPGGCFFVGARVVSCLSMPWVLPSFPPNPSLTRTAPPLRPFREAHMVAQDWPMST